MFNGFTPQTIQFFKDLKENNYKEWFENHRSVYENELLNPFRDLVSALSPGMYNIDPDFELRPHRVLSRIYRDIRFSKNKTPYKTGMWMSFQKSTKEWEKIPGFFFELTAEHYYIGMGLFAPRKSTMEAIRENIAYDAEEFRGQTEAILNNGYRVEGESYKRPLANDLPEYFQQWIQRKSLFVSKTKPVGDELFSSSFADVVQYEFDTLVWLYNFLKNE